MFFWTSAWIKDEQRMSNYGQEQVFFIEMRNYFQKDNKWHIFSGFDCVNIQRVINQK